jgi:hypothetical protein
MRRAARKRWRISRRGKDLLHSPQDEQDYDGSAYNDRPIGNLNASYRCFLAEPFHDFPPDKAASVGGF